jgi:hypothetical protein
MRGTSTLCYFDCMLGKSTKCIQLCIVPCKHIYKVYLRMCPAVQSHRNFAQICIKSKYIGPNYNLHRTSRNPSSFLLIVVSDQHVGVVYFHIIVLTLMLKSCNFVVAW